jgi:hypothetical protein
MRHFRIYLPCLSQAGKDRQEEIWQTGERVRGLLHNLANRWELNVIGRDVFKYHQ